MSQRPTAVVTGASRGLGAAIARRLAPRCRHLVLLARSEDALAALRDELRSRRTKVDFVRADLSSAQAALEAAHRIDALIGTPDQLVLNAGVSNDAPFADTSLDAIAYELGVNTVAPTTLLRWAVPRMRDRGHGRVVVVGSLAAVVPFPGNATYSATKAALLALVRSLRLELDGTGVHLAIVLPGLTRTDATAEMASVLPRMSAEAVAKATAAALVGDRAIVIPGWHNRLAAQLFQAAPDLTEHVLARVAAKVVPSAHQP